MTTFRHLQHYVLVNGGVVLCAVASHCASQLARGLTHDSDIAGAVAGTAVLYALVFTAAAANLRGRARAIERGRTVEAPIALSSIVWHPIGSACERIAHERHLALLQRPRLLPPHLPRRHRSG